MQVLEGLDAAIAWCSTRSSAISAEAAEGAATTIADVRDRGDAALFDLALRFDGYAPPRLRLEPEEIEAGAAEVAPELAAAIDVALDNVATYYREQPSGEFSYRRSGATLGMLVRPLGSVGCYVPGGSAPLFSSLIMTAVPARQAGVSRIAVATPVRSDAGVPASILYVAERLAIDEVYPLGGAQAIAALALGTESVTRVDKVVGPGNSHVVAAKRLLFGEVGIESLPGPTETLVVADESASVTYVAADLLAQAEHVGAQPVLVTTSRDLASAVLAELEGAARSLPDPSAATASLRENGAVILVDDLRQAIAVSNAFAPEHLCLLVEDPQALLPQVASAGGIFIGEHSLEALGDYVAGPSHVMPTAQTARFSSFVNLRDFQKAIPFLAAGPDFVAEVGPSAVVMARAEGLEAHALAVEARLAALARSERRAQAD